MAGPDGCLGAIKNYALLKKANWEKVIENNPRSVQNAKITALVLLSLTGGGAFIVGLGGALSLMGATAWAPGFVGIINASISSAGGGIQFSMIGIGAIGLAEILAVMIYGVYRVIQSSKIKLNNQNKLNEDVIEISDNFETESPPEKHDLLVKEEDAPLISELGKGEDIAEVQPNRFKKEDLDSAVIRDEITKMEALKQKKVAFVYILMGEEDSAEDDTYGIVYRSLDEQTGLLSSLFYNENAFRDRCKEMMKDDYIFISELKQD